MFFDPVIYFIWKIVELAVVKTMFAYYKSKDDIRN